MIRSFRHALWLATILMLGLMDANYVRAALPQTVNPSSPADTDPVSQGASQIRGVKQSLIDIFGVPNNAAVNIAPFGIATDGRVNISSLAATAGGVNVTGYLRANSASPPTYVQPIPIADGGTGLTAASDDTTLVSTGAAWQPRTIPDCTDTSGKHLNYTQSTNSFGCGTSTGASASNSSRTLVVSGNATTTSTSFTDLANASLSLTVAANNTYVLVGWQGSCANSGATGQQMHFDITIDGIRQSGAAAGLLEIDVADTNNLLNCGYTYMTPLQTAGAHTYNVQWRVGGNTGTFYETSPAFLMWVTELH